jgi:ribonuclease HI
LRPSSRRCTGKVNQTQPGDPPIAVQADSGVTRQFKRGTDARSLGKEVVGHVGGGLDALGRLSLPAPISAPWESGRGCWTVSLSLRGGSGPDDPPARKLADALDTIRQYNQLRMVIYTDGSALGGVKRGGSSAVVTSGNPGKPTFLNVRHQYGPEYTTSLEVEMWGLWLALECLDYETVAAGVLICSDSQWAPNALKESGHSAHFILSPLRAHLRALRVVYANIQATILFKVPRHMTVKKAPSGRRSILYVGWCQGQRRATRDIMKKKQY